MATYRGLLTLNGSMGDVTATTWKGKKVLKQKVPANNTSNTIAQQSKRRIFALLASLAGVLGPVIRVGFRTSATDKTEQNVFTSKNYDLVTLDADLIPTIDYTEMVVSAGNVEGVTGLSATLGRGTGVLTIHYTNNSNGASGLPTDKLYLAVVQSTTDKVLTTSMGVHSRAQGGTNFDVTVPSTVDPTDLRVYAFYKRTDSPATSPSAFSLAQ